MITEIEKEVREEFLQEQTGLQKKFLKSIIEKINKHTRTLKENEERLKKASGMSPEEFYNSEFIRHRYGD